MILARLGLAAAAWSLMAWAASASHAGDAAADRLRAIGQMRAWTRLPDRAIVAVTPEMAVALLGRGAWGKADHVDGVELQGEVLDDAFAQARGWRSMRLKVDIACRDGGTSVRRMTVFPQHDHTGLGREAVVPIGWVRPKPEAYLGQVVSAICGSPADAASAAPARPAPVLRGAVVASADPASAPIPATATQPEPAASGVLVQIAATPDEAEAHRILTAAAARMEAATPGLTFHVDPAMVAGRQLYRAVISGFHDRSAAKGWCMALRQAGGACFLR